TRSLRNGCKGVPVMADHVSFIERLRARESATTATLAGVADPRVLGLYAFAGAAFLLATRFAGWYSSSAPGNLFLFPLVMSLGGLLQLLAAMWAYRARDTIATAMLGSWSAFFLGYGALTVALRATGATPTGAFPELGYWYIVLAAISWVGMAAAAAEGDAGAAGWLLFAAAGSTLAAIGLIGGFTVIDIIGAWLFIISAGIAWGAPPRPPFPAPRPRP